MWKIFKRLRLDGIVVKNFFSGEIRINQRGLDKLECDNNIYSIINKIIKRMARKILLKEDGLTGTSNTPSGYRYVGYDGTTVSDVTLMR